MKKNKNRKKEWFLNIATFIVAIFVAIILGELSLRIYESISGNNGDEQEWKPTFEFSASRHHRLIPSVRSQHKELDFDYLWENNSLGMRDRERSIEKNTDSFRILFLGDSMVQGWGVPLEQSMVSLLEKSLNKGYTKNINIFNGGVFGYSPFLEYLYLTELMPLVEPDIVFIALFLGNDVGDDNFYYHQAQRVLPESSFIFIDNDCWPWTDLDELTEKTTEDLIQNSEDISFIEKSAAKFWSKTKPFLMKLHIVSLINNYFLQNEERQAVRERNELMKKLVNQNKDNININLGLVNYPVAGKEQRLNYWHITLNYLSKIKYLCSAKNIPMVLIVIPGDGPIDFNEPDEIINRLANTVSFPVINLRNDLLSYSGSINFPLDGHWNPEGNRLAAAVIDREFRKLNLIPKK